MYVLIGIYIFLVSLLCPILGLISGASYILFTNKNYKFILFNLILVIGYVGSFYLPTKAHDMYRYIGYMSVIPLSSVKNFFSQVYSQNPISAYGLNGQQWPGSALLLYLTAKFGDYRILSAFTLALTYYVRLYAIKSTYEKSKVIHRLYLIIYMCAMIVTIKPLLALSVFRWYLAISILMFCAYLELDNNFKIRYLWLYALAATFHPSAFMFIGLRIISMIFSGEKKTRNIGIGITIIFGIISIIAHNKVFGLLNGLFNHFDAYTVGTVSGMQSIETISYVLYFTLIIFKSVSLIKEANLIKEKHNALNYLVVLVAFNMLLMTLPIFDRIIQYTVPVSLIIIGKYSFNKNKWNFIDYLIPLTILLLGIIEMTVNSYVAFPQLTQPILEILFLPIHFN